MQVVSRRSSVALVCWTLAAGACSVSKREVVVGDYGTENTAAVESLKLKGDGSFEQRVTLKADGRRLVAEGTWSFDAGDSEITFDDKFMMVLDGWGRPVADPAVVHDGVVILPVHRLLGRTRIEYYEGLYYRKIGRRESG